MSGDASKLADGVDRLQAQFHELSLVENDLKRDLAWAKENLDGVRELKSRIGQQIFKSKAAMRCRYQNDSLPTTNNGKNSTGSPRS